MPPGTKTLYSVFVGHLDRTVKKSDLEEVFSVYGQPKNVHIADKPLQCDFTYGFVRFSSKDSALKAVCGHNGVMLKGKPIAVELSSDCPNRADLLKELELLEALKREQREEKIKNDIHRLSCIQEAVISHNNSFPEMKVRFDELLSKLQSTSIGLPELTGSISRAESERHFNLHSTARGQGIGRVEPRDGTTDQEFYTQNCVKLVATLDDVSSVEESFKKSISLTKQGQPIPDLLTSCLPKPKGRGRLLLQSVTD